MRHFWNHSYLVMYTAGLFLGSAGAIMMLWMFDQVEGRPLYLTGISMAVVGGILGERGFRLMVQRDERIGELIEALNRKACTPWAD